MKKILPIFLSTVMVLGSLTFGNITPIQAQVQTQVQATTGLPYSFTASKTGTGTTVAVTFNTSATADLFIGKNDTASKTALYNDKVDSQVVIQEVLLNNTYDVDIHYYNGELYAGTLKAYDKPNSNFIGIMLDLKKVVSGSTSDAGTDYSRMTMATITYEKEANDSFKTTNKIPSDAPIYGKIDTKTDADYFQIMFTSNGDGNFILDNIPAGADYDLYVYDSKQTQIAASCTSNSTESVTVKNAALNVWYYAKVVGFKSSLNKNNYYHLSANITAKPIDTNGHTFETAKVATTQAPVAGEIMYSNDSNYFKFTPSADGTYIINSSGATDTYGSLYNKDKSLLAQNDDKPNDLFGNFEIKTDLKANTLYYIQVRHYSTGTGAFALNISQDSTVQTPDNNIDNPTKVNLNASYTGVLKDASSQYWYYFIPQETGSYKVTSTGNASVIGTLFDYTKTNPIIQNSNVMNTQHFVLANTLVQGQVYYIKIGAAQYNAANNQYGFSVVKIANPNDTDFSQQWGLLNTQNAMDINILPVWEYTKGNGFKIGIADTGADYNHSDLANNINLSLAYNFTHSMSDIFPANENPYSASSAVSGHGTHVAGIIGASINNGQGIAGIASESTLVPLKVLGSRLTDNPSQYTGSIASFVNSIAYAKANGIKVLNCSFGGYSPAVSEEQAMNDAKDILFVIAAGNDGDDLAQYPEYPACYYHDNSLVVAALSQNGQLAGFSCYGGPTDIAAPGDSIWSTMPYNDYQYESGTSMAAPAVTAVAGLVWSLNPNLAPTEIKGIITDTSNVTKLTCLNDKVLSGGLVNAFKAITSSSTSVSVKSATEMQRNVFGRDVKAAIKSFKDKAKSDVKTAQIIVKYADGISPDDFISKINQYGTFSKLVKVEYLDLIGAYVYELGSIEEADKAVDMFNLSTDVKYAEPNYIRN